MFGECGQTQTCDILLRTGEIVGVDLFLRIGCCRQRPPLNIVIFIGCSNSFLLFPSRIHLQTCILPDGATKNQIYHVQTSLL
uniref:Uncharacterized protein n=1 Tax=Megaselia scalaris TaxID=36166 RepID=T1GRE0_MEGSC